MSAAGWLSSPVPGHPAFAHPWKHGKTSFPAQKKRPHCWGHSSKEAKGRKCQERRCKGPIRQPDRRNVRSRERRVKVKRGLFSYLERSTCPAKTADPGPLSRPSHKSMQTGNLFMQRTLRHESPRALARGNKMHIPAHWLQDTTPPSGSRDLYRDPGRGYELPATVRSLPGRK